MKTKRVLALILACIMVFTMLPTSVFAETTEQNGSQQETAVAAIGETQYKTLEAAFANVENGDTITLLADITDATTTEIEAGKNVTLDLAGHKIETAVNQSDKHYYAIDNYGTFTLKDTVGNGEIRARGISNNSGGTMTIEGGKIVAIDTNGGAAIWNEGNLSITGGSFEVTYAGSSSDTYGAGCLNNRGTAVISGGTFTSVNKRTYAIVSSGEITISNVTVTGAHGGLAIDSGTATVNGGSYTSTEYYGLYVSNDGTGTPAKAQVTVNDGEFTGNWCSVHIGSDVNTPVDSVIEIKNGLFHGDIEVEEKVSEGAGISITGGTFSEDPSSYVAEGYKAVDNGNGTWTVQADNAVAQIGSVKYATLADAVAAVPTDNTETTITMIADSTEPAVITVASGKNIELDLNGKTVSYSADAESNSVYFITNKGTLTVKDTSANADGMILFTAPTYDSGYSKENVTVYNLGGTLYLQSGTIKNATAGGLSYAVNNSSNAWGTGDDKISTFNMTGGRLTAPSGDAALRVYQNCAVGNVQSKNYVNISGGTIVDSGIFVDTYIHQPTAQYTGDNIDTKITISGGTINGLIDLKVRHPFNTKLDITGGVFTNAKLWVRKHSEWSTNVAEPTAPYVDISGGEFSFVPGKAFGLAYDCGATSWTNYKHPYLVSGGVFSVDLNNCTGVVFPVGKTGVANTDAATRESYPYTVGVETVYVAQIGETQYETLAEAVAAVKDDETIVLLENAPRATINNGKTFTIDLNGKNLAGITLNSGFLTVADTGETKGTITDPVRVYTTSDNTAAAGEYNSFTLAVGATTKEVFVFPTNNKGYGSKVVIRGTINSLIFVHGSILEGNTVVDVYGTINSDEDVGIGLNGFATVNVYKGARIEAQDPNQDGKGTGIEVRAGNLNVSDGTIIGHGVPTVVTPNGNGTTSTGAGIAVAQHTSMLPIDVNISGGTISGYSAFYESNPQNNAATDIAKIKLSISGGSFKATEGGTQSIFADDTATIGRFITGGIYSDSIDARYIATGYAEADNSHEVYTKKVVKASGSAVNTDENDVLYSTVEAGISAVVTNDTVNSITTSAAATVGSVTIAKDGTVAVAENGDSGVTASGTTVVTATEVAITNGSESSAYAITKTVGDQVQGSTLATATLGNGMNSNANPSVYVKDVAEKLADAVLNSEATVSSDLEVNLALDVVTKNKVESGDTITLDVELQGVYTVNGTAGTPEEIPNSELATGASFTFRVAAPAGATKVNVVHSWANDPTYGTGSETFYDLPVVNGYVEVTLTHFSSLAISTSSTFESTLFDGEKTDVDFVYNVYMNLQDGLYMTYVVYVSHQSKATTAVLTDNGTEYVIPLSSATGYDASTFNASMRSSVITNGYYCAKYTATHGDFYYFVVSKYPNYMAKNVSIKLTDGSATQTLYENTTMGSNVDVTNCTLYSLENDVFTTTMVKFLTGVKNDQPSSSNSYKMAATLLDYYAYAKALYGEN